MNTGSQPEVRRGHKRTRAFGSFELPVQGRRLVFRTQPGVFSQDGPDEGTLLLLNAACAQVKPHATVLDLGTGVGILGIAIAGLLSRGEAWLVDCDVRAVRLAEENQRANGAENVHVMLGDITLDLPPRLRFDLVVTNPPTHSGKEVLSAFVTEAHEVLRPGGSLYVVVNRLLSVRSMMEQAFGNVEQIERRKGFIVLRADKSRGSSEANDY